VRIVITHCQQILAAVDLGLSTSSSKASTAGSASSTPAATAPNSATAVIAIIFLCRSGLTGTLPTGSEKNQLGRR
jgi:hypothetical protein